MLLLGDVPSVLLGFGKVGNKGYFVPGIAREPPLGSPFWPALPQGVVSEYVRGFIPDGGLILNPFCSAPELLREAVEAGCRVIATHFNPLATFVIKACGLEISPEEMDAAFTRLADAFRGQEPLRNYLQALYRVECPSCGQEVEAGYFLWESDEEGKRPVEKALECPRCGNEGVFPIQERDITPVQKFRDKGPDYWYVLGRLIPLDEPIPPPVELLPLAYTPRTLHCLNAIFVKLQTLFPERGPYAQFLKLVLLVTMHRCLSLFPEPEPTRRPTRLRPPARFVEHNAWHMFQEALNALKPLVKALPFLSLEVALEQEHPGAFLAPWSIRRLSRQLPPDKVDLVVTEPPVLDGAYWALNFLWAGWLLGPAAASPLRPFVRERPLGWDWYTRSMERALVRLKDLVKPGGVFLMLGESLSTAWVESLVAAGAGAGLELEGLVIRENEGRLDARIFFSKPRKVAAVATVALEERLRQLVLEMLQYLGEPVSQEHLRLALGWWITAREGWRWSGGDGGESGRVRFQKALEDALTSLEGEGLICRWPGKLWGLTDYSSASIPWTDRAEEVVWEVLQGSSPLTLEALLGTIYARLPQPLVPSQELLEACIASYGEEQPGGLWRLRMEDDPSHRRQDRAEMARILGDIGQRMGFQVAEGEGPFDVVWREKGPGDSEILYGFRIESTAALTRLFLLWPDPAPFRAYVVIPGGRAALVCFKERHFPLWAAVVGGKWQFIKYRHLRRLMAEESLDRYSLQKIIGLDPVVERPGAQIPLW